MKVSSERPLKEPTDKVRRQQAWLANCRAKGMSAAQINRAASLIPPDAVIRVRQWPTL